MHPTVAKNRAHHADPIWAKAGRSEYIRADGVTIRKHPRISAWWEVFLPSGQRPQMPNTASASGFLPGIPAAAQTLADAKWFAESITPDSPVFVAPSGPRGRV